MRRAAERSQAGVWRLSHEVVLAVSTPFPYPDTFDYRPSSADTTALAHADTKPRYVDVKSTFNGAKRRRQCCSVAGSEALMAMVTVEISHGGAESPAVFVLRAGPEARRSLSTTPDDCPSPRHAVRRRTLGRGIWPRSDGIVLAGRLRTRIRTVFEIGRAHV